MLQVVNFAFTHYEYLLLCLKLSIYDPEATRLTIQNLNFLMRTHRRCRQIYAQSSHFDDWCKSIDNPLYSHTSVQGILLVGTDSPDGDIFVPEAQLFIHYIGEENWPWVPEGVVSRFRRIWRRKTEDHAPAPPFGDPIERWFSDHESERSDGWVTEETGDDEDEPYDATDFLREPRSVPDAEIGTLFDSYVEAAGLVSQARRRNSR